MCESLLTFILYWSFSDWKGSNFVYNGQKFKNSDTTRVRETYKSGSSTWRSTKADGCMDNCTGTNPWTWSGNYYTCYRCFLCHLLCFYIRNWTGMSEFNHFLDTIRFFSHCNSCLETSNAPTFRERPLGNTCPKYIACKWNDKVTLHDLGQNH